MKTITIKGTIDELVECELHLIFMGYNKPDEIWNNDVLSSGGPIDRIFADADGTIEYHYHPYNEVTITAKDFLSEIN